MSIQEKEYKLDDGSVWKPSQLAKKLGVTATAARQRLRTSKDAKIVKRPAFLKQTRYKCRLFTLSDGSVLDSTGCAERFDINQSTMYARLARGIRDVKELARTPTNGSHPSGKNGYVPIENQSKEVRKMLQERNFFDPMSRLFLKTA